MVWGCFIFPYKKLSILYPISCHHRSYVTLYDTTTTCIMWGWWKIKEKMFVAYLLQYYYCAKKKKKQYTRQASRYTIVEWIIYFYRNKACVCTLYFMGERQKCGKKIIQRGKFFLCVFLHVGCRRRCRPYIRFKWHYLLVDYRDAQTDRIAFIWYLEIHHN